MRARISQDLHDEVGSTLSSIHVYSSVATKTLDNDPEQAKGALKKINENTRLVMENMSDIVWAINTGQIGETSLEAKLKNYGYELLTPLNIQCSYQIDKETEKKLTNIEARRNILLIVKEALNNIAKYSSATKVMVRLEKADKNIVLEIADNGKGFEKETGHMGQGLNNMKQRAEVLGGKLNLTSEKDQGTTVKCIIPVTILSD
jgi:signal transduction histidine kinase